LRSARAQKDESSLSELSNLNHEQIDEFVHQHRLEAFLVLAQIQDDLRLLRREAPREIGLELRLEQWNPVLAPAAVPDRVLDDYFIGARSIPEVDCYAVGDRALVWVEVVLAELLVLDTFHLVAQRVDARIVRYVVLVVGRRQTPEDQRHRDHVLNA